MDQGENRLQYGNWLRVQLNGNGQNRGNWRNGVEIIESKVEANTETNEGKKRSGDESELMGLKEKEKIKVGEEDSESGSTIEKRHTRLMRDGEGRNRGKRERIRGGNGENVDESPAKVVRRKLMDFISPEDNAWYLDSGSTHHLTHFVVSMSESTSYSGSGMVYVGDGAALPTIRTGQSSLLICFLIVYM
ncbi:hypothetical protein PVK06_002748 [Gossypium arboreum]|uniref:Uncharacterized protein n=1 Tax=Gossypium arboreum TaxID=29729 RepID=A0ABR0R5T6_GOSAR|nr:hypothetical protein PVK06_002748 [Gossypium arboreum]